MAGFRHKNETKNDKPQPKNQIVGESLLKKAIECHIKGDFINAEKAYRTAIDWGISNVY